MGCAFDRHWKMMASDVGLCYSWILSKYKWKRYCYYYKLHICIIFDLFFPLHSSDFIFLLVMCSALFNPFTFSMLMMLKTWKRMRQYITRNLLMNQMKNKGDANLFFGEIDECVSHQPADNIRILDNYNHFISIDYIVIGILIVCIWKWNVHLWKWKLSLWFFVSQGPAI